MAARKEPPPQMFRVTGRHICAATIVSRGVLIAAAPILQWAIRERLTIDQFKRQCAARGWQVEEVQLGAPVPRKWGPSAGN